MKGGDTALLILGGVVILGVGFFALRPRSASAAGPEPPRGAGGSGVGLNIGGTKGFTLKVPETTADRIFGAAKVAF